MLKVLAWQSQLESSFTNLLPTTPQTPGFWSQHIFLLGNFLCSHIELFHFISCTKSPKNTEILVKTSSLTTGAGFQGYWLDWARPLGIPPSNKMFPQSYFKPHLSHQTFSNTKDRNDLSPKEMRVIFWTHYHFLNANPSKAIGKLGSCSKSKHLRLNFPTCSKNIKLFLSACKLKWID